MSGIRALRLPRESERFRSLTGSFASLVFLRVTGVLVGDSKPCAGLASFAFSYWRTVSVVDNVCLASYMKINQKKNKQQRGIPQIEAWACHLLNDLTQCPKMKSIKMVWLNYLPFLFLAEVS